MGVNALLHVWITHLDVILDQQEHFLLVSSLQAVVWGRLAPRNSPAIPQELLGRRGLRPESAWGWNSGFLLSPGSSCLVGAGCCGAAGAVVQWVLLHSAAEMHNQPKSPPFLPCCLWEWLQHVRIWKSPLSDICLMLSVKIMSHVKYND